MAPCETPAALAICAIVMFFCKSASRSGIRLWHSCRTVSSMLIILVRRVHKRSYSDGGGFDKTKTGSDKLLDR